LEFLFGEIFTRNSGERKVFKIFLIEAGIIVNSNLLAMIPNEKQGNLKHFYSSLFLVKVSLVTRQQLERIIAMLFTI